MIERDKYRVKRGLAPLLLEILVLMRIRYILILLLFPVALMAQPLKELYRETLELGDTTLQMKILTGWEEMRPTDPELCIAYADHYYKKSRKKKAKADSLPYIGIRATLLDDTTTPRGNPKYYAVKVNYDADLLGRALEYLSRGIAANPDHIDLRMKKISFLQASRNWAVTTEVIDLLMRAKQNQNKWLVQDSVPWDAVDTLLPFLQRASRQIYTMGLGSYSDVGAIAKGILELYPQHHQSLIDLGRSYYYDHEFKTALTYFHRAEEIMPHSLQAFGYSALCYYYIGDGANAIKYFDKLKELGDEEDRHFADLRIQELTVK